MKPASSSLIHHVLMPEQSAAPSHPTLIMLHGRGADEEDLASLASYLDDRLMILSVRAPFAFPYGGGYTWYDADTIGNPEPTMFKFSYDKLTLFLGDALEAYPIDRSKIFLLGFSMGTVMAYSLAFTSPKMFRGVVANSGYIPERTHLSFRLNELSKLEFFIAHGTFDPVIPVAAGRRAKELLLNANASITYKEYPMAHQISEESLADFSTWLKQRLDN
jgi:phospholipase/carboxylesterase